MGKYRLKDNYHIYQVVIKLYNQFSPFKMSHVAKKMLFKASPVNFWSLSVKWAKTLNNPNNCSLQVKHDAGF